MSGTAIATKGKGARSAAVVSVTRASLGSHPRKGFTLVPGINNKQRSTVINGNKFGDVPTRYTIFGLESYEIPVIGNYNFFLSKNKISNVIQIQLLVSRWQL